MVFRVWNWRRFGFFVRIGMFVWCLRMSCGEWFRIAFSRCVLRVGWSTVGSGKLGELGEVFFLVYFDCFIGVYMGV